MRRLESTPEGLSRQEALRPGWGRPRRGPGRTGVPAAVAAILTMLLVGCGAPWSPLASPQARPGVEAGEPAGTTLNVFAASSLTEAFDEVGRKFEALNPGLMVTFSYAASNQLAQQIVEGAPADVFASANMAQMDVVIESGAVKSGAQRTFARNRLTVIYPRDNPAQITTLGDLANPDLKLVLAAPQVPAGQYALDFLAKASRLPEFTGAYGETVLANVVSYEQNVRAVLTKVALGEADAGIVYSSDIAGDAKDQVGTIDIPDHLNTLATYPIAPVSGRPDHELAQRFVEYVLSADAQAILARYGFVAAGAGD